MQCDETRPVCVNCGTSSRTCVYALTPASLPGQTVNDGYLKSVQQALTPGSASGTGPLSPATMSSSAGTPGSSHQHQGQSRQRSPSPASFPSDVKPANISQLELFHHACNQRILLPIPIGDAEVLSGIVEASLAAPYLMNALLAMSALHLSRIRPAQSTYYHHQAVEYQTHALSIFNVERPQVSSENALSLLLFSQLTSLQVLHEITLSSIKHDAMEPLDRFLDYIKVHRGVAAVAKEAWDALLQSKLSIFFANSSSISECKTSEGEETAELRSFVSISRSLSNEQKQYCQDSIDRLQWIISRSGPNCDYKPNPKQDFLPTDDHQCLSQVLAWPCLARESFLDLLCCKNAEALLVLAYYGVTMHRNRTYWIYADVGSILVRAIARNLGPNWQHFMAWPLAQICDTSGQDASMTTDQKPLPHEFKGE